MWYIHEGTEAPEKCPVCKAPASKFKELKDPTEGPAFATVHTLGAARDEEATPEMIKISRLTSTVSAARLACISL